MNRTSLFVVLLIAAVAAKLALLACSDSVSVAVTQRQRFVPPDLLRGDTDHKHKAWSQCELGTQGSAEVA